MRPHKDIPIKFTGLRPGETLHEGLLVPGEIRCATTHPHIFSVESPRINGDEFLSKTGHLLNGNLQSEPGELKEMVVNLARHAQAQNIISKNVYR